MSTFLITSIIDEAGQAWEGNVTEQVSEEKNMNRFVMCQ